MKLLSIFSQKTSKNEAEKLVPEEVKAAVVSALYEARKQHGSNLLVPGYSGTLSSRSFMDTDALSEEFKSAVSNHLKHRLQTEQGLRVKIMERSDCNIYNQVYRKYPVYRIEVPFTCGFVRNA